MNPLKNKKSVIFQNHDNDREFENVTRGQKVTTIFQKCHLRYSQKAQFDFFYERCRFWGISNILGSHWDFTKAQILWKLSTFANLSTDQRDVH